MRLRTKTSIILAAALTATLAGCAPPSSPADDGTISVVASTNVYGDIAETVGGDLIEVTSIIDDPSQDPHSFEADARVQLALSKADIVIENGGGYDPFVDRLLAGLDVPGQTVLSAVELSPLTSDGENHAAEHEADAEHADAEHADDEHAGHDHGSFNEHVWYDFPTIAALVAELQGALTELDPANGDQYERNATGLLSDLDSLQQRASAMDQGGGGVAVTEPVALHLLEAVGLHNLTPAEFSSAIEGGTEVSAATLNRMLELLSAGEVELLVYNDQTTSPETEALFSEAERAGIPVLSVTELLPQGSDYVEWMNDVLDDLEHHLELS